MVKKKLKIDFHNFSYRRFLTKIDDTSLFFFSFFRNNSFKNSSDQLKCLQVNWTGEIQYAIKISNYI